MELSKISPNWPNALRWFLVQNLHSFTPWHLISDADEFKGAGKAFEREDINNRKVFVFASRQDCDDFAGLEVVDGEMTDRVIYFHPVFSSDVSDRKWDIVCDQFEDVFDFMSKQVMDDMKDWALTEDANSLYE